MTRERFDTIVIGAGISGMGLASLLGQSGQRVLTLEKGRNLGGRAHSFEQRGHTTNMGGPRAGLENGKVDGLFAALGKEPGERGFFEDVKTVYNGELISLPELAFRGSVGEAGVMIKNALQTLEQGDLARYDAMSAHDWVSELVTSREVVDVARFSAIVMSTLPRLEDISASTLFESLRIISANPRIYLAAYGYGDFIRILAEASRECGGEVRAQAVVDEIVVEDGHVCGVVLHDGQTRKKETIEASRIATAFPIWDLFKIVDRNLFPADFSDRIARLDRQTAIFGITAAVSEPIYEGKYFLLTDGPRCEHPISGFMASNVAPSLSPEGEHLFEVCCQCDIELGDDRERLRRTIEALREDLDEIFPGWQKHVLWSKSYFHWEEPARNPGRAGSFRPGVKAPAVEGLYFTGDTIASRSLPGLECAADSAMLCAEAILG